MYTQYKLLDLVEGKDKVPEAAKLNGVWMKRSFNAYMLLVQAVGGRQLDHIKDLLVRILEEDLQHWTMERSKERVGYGVGGGKSGFKKKWKGKNKDNPKEDSGGGQGEVCFYCKKRIHRWRKCYQRPKDWTPPSSSNHHGGKRSGGVIGASGEEKDEEKGGKSEERKAGFFFVNEGVNTEMIGSESYRAFNDERLIWDLQRKGDVHKQIWQILVLPWPNSGKAAAAASMEESVTEEEQQGVQGKEPIGGSAAEKASATWDGA
ncbi:unnamed protein product [Closterium sp. NIES-65]|nr:unnamed protein product [Closterium sp. NIES-65]